MADYKNGDTASWDAQQVRRGQTDRPQPNTSTRRRKKRRRMNPLLAVILYVLIVAAASATMAGVGWLLASDLCAFNRGTKTEVTVEVSAEDTLDTRRRSSSSTSGFSSSSPRSPRPRTRSASAPIS